MGGVKAGLEKLSKAGTVVLREREESFTWGG
jgi:hypothetical protein